MQGWIKINKNGAFKENLGLACCGRTIRNEEKRWLNGFLYNLGTYNSFVVEFWGAFYGLKMAWKMEFRYVMLDFDSKALVHLLNKEKSMTMQHQTLLSKCKQYYN